MCCMFVAIVMNKYNFFVLFVFLHLQHDASVRFGFSSATKNLPLHPVESESVLLKIDS